ncbi:MAG TPA: RidA family protein [Candidatus Binataceae bacterium]|nr:RidA family protein [Candidatus Binataceae bacterium]
MNHQTLQPPGWARPRGYANGIAARGRLVFVAGQVGWDAAGLFRSDRFADQVRQALANIVAIVAEAGGRPEHLVRLTWYITDRQEYLAESKAVGTAYRDVLDRHFPAMSVVEIAALIEPGAKVEIEATAVIPDPAD